MHPLLDIRNLVITFEQDGIQHTAVNDLSLTLNHGEVLGIAGESGSGKSVTALALLQLLPSPPSETRQGSAYFAPQGKDPVDLLSLSPERIRDIRGRQISMIFQEPMTSLNPLYTCGDQVAEAIRLYKNVSNTEALRKTIALFGKVKLPDPETIIDRYPHQLSGGQKQRVMIAMAMSGDPSLLICDEPTTALDVTVQKNVLELIAELQRDTRMGVIFISHDLSLIASVADKVAIMYRGSIVESGTADRVFGSPQHAYTRALLACRPALYSKGTRLPVVSDFMDRDTGTPVQYAGIAGGARPAGPDDREQPLLLSVRRLSVSFPAKRSVTGRPLTVSQVVKDVSFDVVKGETLGLVGASGSGKTTVGKVLCGLLRPTSGTILHAGTAGDPANPADTASLRRHFQMIFQDPYSSLNPGMTIGDAIGEALLVHRLVSDKKSCRDVVISMLRKVGLDPAHARRYPHEFSGGQRQRIVIARALVLNPKFIVCDESVAALDVSVQAQVLNLLNDLRDELGFTCLFISHDLSVVRYLSDRIIVMHQGRVVESGPAERVCSQPSSEYTRSLIDAIPASAGREQGPIK